MFNMYICSRTKMVLEFVSPIKAMPSSSNSLENISSRMQAQKSKNEVPSMRFRRSTQSCHKESTESMGPVHIKTKNSELTEQATLGNSKDLSHDDLLLLLSILEGEIQARDEVIRVLRAEKIDLALLEANYGFVTSPKVLQALQRDSIRSNGHGWREDIYEKPIVELDKLVEKQKETYRLMLEQLLQVEQAHRQTLYRLEDEKQNHQEYMRKSDEFTSLLEQEGERLKLLNEQEKSHQKQTEEENNIKVAKLKDELTKLKSFALLVIDEQQHVTEQLAQQSTKVWELQATTKEAQEELNSVRATAHEMESKVLHLEAELNNQSVQFHQQQEAICNKLADEQSENGQLRQKLATLGQKMGELEKLNKTLCRAGEELQKLREKKSMGNENYILVSEVKELRKRVVEMEGKDEELIKMEDLCTDLKRKLEKESIQNCSLRSELDTLNRRVFELGEIDNVCAESKQECSSLKCNLEEEQTVTKHMCNELDNLRIRIKELEAAESLLQKTEWTLKEDITKLKTLTVLLVDERKNMAEKQKQLENKVQDSAAKLQAEQDKVTLVTEKLIKESKKALKLKVEMEEKICIATKESNDLKMKLKSEEDKNNDLQSQVSLMKKRLLSMEAAEREFLRNKANQDAVKTLIKNGFPQEDNKIKDLTQEVERLRRKVGENNVVEKDLQTQNESKSLENRYFNEKALLEELEIARHELSKYQLVEKKNLDQELLLYRQLKEEEVNSSNLNKEVEALKEKIHNYMGIEESICNMKTEYATLQRKLTQQEIRNKELVREKESLTRELDRYHRFSKSLRPGMIGRRLSDLQVSAKEVQTEPTDSPPITSKNPSILELAVVNEKTSEDPSKRSSSSPNYSNNSTKHGKLVSESLEKQHLNNCNLQNTQNGTCSQKEHIIVTHNLSQLLHIKVTPEYSFNASTPKITTTENIQPHPNSTTMNIYPYSTTTVIPNSDCTRKQVAMIPNPPVSPQNHKCHISVKGSVISDLKVSSVKTSTITGDSEKVQKSGVEPDNSVSCETPRRQNDCNAQRYNRDVLSKKDKLCIHSGVSCPQTTNGNTEPVCFPGKEQENMKLTNNISAKVDTKIAGSIMKPPSTPIPPPIQFAVPVEAFQQSGPTKIPKPRAYVTPNGTNSRATLTHRTGTAKALPKLGKNNYMNAENLFTMS